MSEFQSHETAWELSMIGLTERKTRHGRIGLVGFGGLLFLLGLLCWYLLYRVLIPLAPFAEWPRMIARVGIVVPILFAACWKYDVDRKNEIGYLLLGWAIGAGSGKALLFIGGLAPHG